MQKINWKVRLSNPQFIGQLVLSVLLPILAYMGIGLEDLTSWSALGNVLVEAVGNPFILATVGVSVYNAIVDPTTAGFGDSFRALEYDKPNKDL